ncbi:MAG: hypothetical protein ACREOS_04375 [Candidatus Dormibacteraceae bacterium]
MAEIISLPLPPRRLRSNPRVVKRKVSSFNVKRAYHQGWPQPTQERADRIRFPKKIVLGLALVLEQQRRPGSLQVPAYERVIEPSQ